MPIFMMGCNPNEAKLRDRTKRTGDENGIYEKR